MQWHYFSPEEVEILGPQHAARIYEALLDLRAPLVTYGICETRPGTYECCVCDSATQSVLACTGPAHDPRAQKRAELFAAFLNHLRPSDAGSVV